MAHVQQFATASETVTATIVSPLPTGESFGTPISIGYYPGSLGEVWIEAEGQRFNVQCDDVPALCKELKRAALLAKAESEQ